MKHLLILIFTFIIGYKLFDIYPNYSFFDFIILFPCILFFAIFTLNFIKDFNLYLKSKSLLNFSATFFGYYYGNYKINGSIIEKFNIKKDKYNINKFYFSIKDKLFILLKTKKKLIILRNS
jgi:hypothetical protein